MSDHPASIRTGLLLGVGAFVCWGLLPLYLHLLDTVPALQVLAYRVIFSLLLLVAVVAVLGRGRAILRKARGRTLALLSATALLIAINWFVYIWSVQNGHVLEASLGYFINPLLNVLLGVAVLRERITRVQAGAVAIAGVGVVLLALDGGGALWISLALAVSFGLYGLIRKVVAIDALGGLLIETALLLLPAVAIVGWAQAHGSGTFGQNTRIDVLLVLAGAVTAAPLLMFAAAARRLRYATLGLLQYIGPTLQFLEAVLIFGEPLRPAQLLSFALIWLACALYAVAGWRAAAGEKS
ncbi:EamA family transporter RarD [Sphingomonas yunnanensis]|uniref:EamA family transporter RarD n=1 Tax=Sphingomonas yunnanensis TaxID=310400 RepID=UPI001CA6840E|nr:EamA family transporter RarD [Sphingomonas yunnanensis]MBY9064706.1 EamA family transporter RarD [Sphingomonas yunnanensis]